ncbi:integral membrane sensor signal transduction histidine kinase [Rhizobium leguminosarum bv. trifolii WSM2304]|uniref:histidine kinase n=1 Tax=Rhizobium leguminosarum bv. trifolii (strain WSM2304) TaxID=395492 RepID=A0ABF7QNS6_RHILW|nr:HAMP domain-containing sensor histidine kinase [Rhizobium leguminosarum]ACI55559.1 integral membrane sensor signal transduction histidine kinase [Rhizobium leguminosarum bv. trifolii WSM2304]
MNAPLFKPRSIAGRLLMFSGIFVTLALVVAAIVLWLALKTVVREQVDQRLDTQIGALAGAVTRDAAGRIALSAPLDAPPFDRPSSGWYWQIDDGEQRLTSRSLMNGTIDAPPPRQDLRHMLMGMPTSGTGGDRGRGPLYLRQAVRSIDGVALTITATAPMIALVGPALRALFWLVPCMLLLGLVLMAGTLWQIRFGLRPLTSMAANIDAINRGERARLPEEASAELAPLSLKTNALLAASDERLAATRMQFANLAHGLKTPVASLLLALDEQNDPKGALRGLAARIDNRIKHHLAAARRVMASSNNVASTDLAASIADLHRAIGQIYAERSIAFDTDITERLWVACDESDVEEMLGNLIDNAFKWATSRVTVRARRDGPTARITIEDDGPGIPPDRLAAVMQPGVREDETVPGNGFGLSIVNELAGLYGGSLVLEANDAAGLRCVLCLPVTVGVAG